VKEITLIGVRGEVDRRTEKPAPGWIPRNRTWRWGDFEFEKFQIHDLLLTLQ
jgi:hypothetical protein